MLVSYMTIAHSSKQEISTCASVLIEDRLYSSLTGLPFSLMFHLVSGFWLHYYYFSLQPVFVLKSLLSFHDLPNYYYCCCCCYYYYSETGIHYVAQAGLEQQSSCLSLLRAAITGLSTGPGQSFEDTR